MLTAVDTLCAVGGVNGSTDAVAALAAWFHDAVYAVDPAAANEAESASLAARQLGRWRSTPTLTARVVAVVLDTASHELSAAGRRPTRPAWWCTTPTCGCWPPRSRASTSTAPRCARSTRTCRWRPTRAAASEVLRPFLVRDHVYRTAHARAEWEPSARENLARELTRLAG